MGEVPEAVETGSRFVQYAALPTGSGWKDASARHGRNGLRGLAHGYHIKERERAMTETTYTAVRITYDSHRDFNETRARFDERLPVFEGAASVELVLEGASWPEVEAAVDARVGPTGLVALSRLDQGALLSLQGEPLEATLYLVGNPIVARQVTHHDPAAALYAPFRVAIYRDATGVHIAYDQPSSVFASLGSPAIDVIAAQLDDKIRTAVESSCR
jgi:uncharacterized protein (DUF302 family)